MTTFGDQVFEFGGSPVNGIFTTEKEVFFVKPGSGSNGKDGRNPKTSLATIQQGHTNITADKNGVVYLVSEDNSASGTTNRVQATVAGAGMTWSKDGTKLIGVSSGGMIGSRARISNATSGNAANVTPLVSWTASNSSMQNIHVFYGEADAGDLGCFDVTGERNYFYRCHFGGIGSTTQDAAGAYSLKVTGDENMFEECVIGIDTVGRGSAANSELLFSGQATRNIFKNCLILTYADAATHQFLIAGALALDRWLLFDNCTFINPAGAPSAGATTMTEAFDTNASLGGTILLKDCMLVGATEWEAGDTGNVLVVGGTPAAGTTGSGGTGIAVEPS